MASRIPLVAIGGFARELPAGDSVADSWQLSKERDTAAIIAKTLTKRRTYLTGAAGATMAMTLPAGSASIDGFVYSVMSTTLRLLTTWTSAGATFVAAPGTMGAGVPYSFQYDHASTTWFLC